MNLAEVERGVWQIALNLENVLAVGLCGSLARGMSTSRVIFLLWQWGVKVDPDGGCWGGDR